MVVRTFDITITDMGASPSAVKAGMVGEHKAAALRFILPDEYIGSYSYYLDILTGSGESISTDNIVPAVENEDTVINFEIPSTVTSLGNADIILNIVKIGTGDAIDMLVRSVSIHLQFNGIPVVSSQSIDDEFISAFRVLLSLLNTYGAEIPNWIKIQDTMPDEEECLIWLDTASEGNSYAEIIADAEAAGQLATAAAESATDAAESATVAAEAATPLIVATNTNLPITAADGKEVIVREIDQTFPWLLKNIDSTLGFETPTLVSAQQKGLFIKKTPPKPDFTALGISPQALIVIWSTVFGNVKPYDFGNETYLHWHTGMHVDLYYMFFLPAGLIAPVDILVFSDLMWDWGNWDSEIGRFKYFYIWDTVPADPENPEYVPYQAGWHEVTEWDEDNNISNSIVITEMPDIRISCSVHFEDNATGLKTAEYFSTICNDRPFTYRRYLRDNGEWILLI